MNTVEAIHARKSVRAFSDKQISDNVLNKILEATRFAPSAFNRQEWRLIIVKDSEKIQQLVIQAKTPPFVAKAPVVVVACANANGPIMGCGQPCFVIDVAIALDHLSLAAVEYGVGSCWISVFNGNKIKEIFSIPKEIRVIALMILGYPLKESNTKKRLPLSQLMKFEKWSDDKQI